MKIKIPPKKQIVIYLLSIFLMILLFNFLTPLLADDFGYSFGTDGKIKKYFRHCWLPSMALFQLGWKNRCSLHCSAFLTTTKMDI